MDPCSKKTFQDLPSGEHTNLLTTPITRKILPRVKAVASTGLSKNKPDDVERYVDTPHRGTANLKGSKPPPNIYEDATGSTVKNTKTSTNKNCAAGPTTQPFNGSSSKIHTTPLNGREAHHKPSASCYQGPCSTPPYNHYAFYHYWAHCTSFGYHGMVSQHACSEMHDHTTLPYGAPTHHPTSQGELGNFKAYGITGTGGGQATSSSNASTCDTRKFQNVKFQFPKAKFTLPRHQNGVLNWVEKVDYSTMPKNQRWAWHQDKKEERSNPIGIACEEKESRQNSEKEQCNSST